MGQTMARWLSPTVTMHPGPWIRSELQRFEVTETALAEAMGLRLGEIADTLDGRADLSPDMARRLAGVFGVKAGAMLRMQERARKRPPG